MQAVTNPDLGSTPFFVFWAPRIVHSPLQVNPLALAVKCKLACKLAWPRASGFPGCAMAFSH